MSIPVPDETVMIRKEVVQNELVRKVSGKLVDQLYEEERAQQIKEENPITHTNLTEAQEEVKIHLQEDLLRHMNAVQADKLADDEKKRRVSEDKMFEVQCEIVRRSSLKETIRLEEL
eukprot:Ihof_evm20s29 gene=Ihof_evmTU20s29